MIRKLMLSVMAVVLFCTVGCMSDNQLKAEVAFYNAATSTQANKQASPLVDIEVGDPTQPINLKSIRVFAPPSPNEQIRQYVQTDYARPWLNIVSSAIPLLGTWGIVKAVGDAVNSSGGTSYNQSISGTGNTASLTTTGPTNMSLIGDGNVAGGIVDQTSVPTVVDPLVVNPTIVHPEVVNPVVVDPVIVP